MHAANKLHPTTDAVRVGGRAVRANDGDTVGIVDATGRPHKGGLADGYPGAHAILFTVPRCDIAAKEVKFATDRRYASRIVKNGLARPIGGYQYPVTRIDLWGTSRCASETSMLFEPLHLLR
jgi:hypothetical protein